MKQEVVESLQRGLSPKFIACVAGLWTPNNKYCLPAATAAGVIRASGTRVLVLHIPNPKSTNLLNDEILSLDELTQGLSFPLSEMVIFFNTSMCSTFEDVQQVLKMMNFVRSMPPYNSAAAFLKMEVLDENLHPEDEQTCVILEQLPLEARSICIPFLVGDGESLKYVTSLGCPAVRIWSSKIGGGVGITDEPRLMRLINSTSVPLILEGGLSTPEHVRQALQMGFSAALMNNAFRHTLDPIKLATDIRTTIDNMYGE